MERDNFEEQLRNLIVQKDQRSNNLSNKERVWAKINTRTYTKKNWYYAAAAVFIFGLSMALINTIKMEREEIKPREIVLIKSKNSPIEPNLPQSPQYVKNTPLIKIAKEPIKAEIETVRQKSELKLLVVEKINPIFLTENLHTENNINQKNSAVLSGITSISKLSLNNPEKTPSSKEETFTIQFKRGAQIILKDEEEENPILIAFKIFKLKRDTNIYIASAIENQSSIFKLTFKKEN